MTLLSLDETFYLLHHVVLPPKLPEADDWEVEYEDTLLDTTIEALRTLSEVVRDEEGLAASHIDLVVSSIYNLRRVRNTSGFISESQLADLLHDLASGKQFGYVPLHIKAQNAAVLVSKQEAGVSIFFEVFELSPLNEITLKTKGRLRRSFPTYACEISLQQIQEKGLIESLAHTLSKMSCEEAPGFQPQTRKNKKDHDETRDTTHPGLITDFFIHLISVVGQPIQTQGIWKNTREDVLWNNALLPWRRSPLWLLVRTTMQIQLTRLSSAMVYKAVMVHVLAGVLQSASRHQESIGTDLVYVTCAKLASRLQKLRKQNPKGSYDIYTKSALILLEDTRSKIVAKIRRVTNGVDDNINMAVLASLQPHDDLDINLPQLDEFITGISFRKQQSDITEYHPVSKCVAFSEHELPTGFSGSGDYTYFYLASVEKWVEDHLSSWLERNLSNSTTCEQLHRLLKDYFRCANSAYSALSDIPASLSIMYLTVVELWVACDKCACQLYPLLRQFDPEVELTLFQSLSLPFKSQLERLSVAETYVQSRGFNATANAPSLYRDFGLSSSFAVRFFDNSQEHKDLRSDIEEDAAMRKREKCDELVQKKQLYHDLMNKSNELRCVYEEVYDRHCHSTRTRHASWCEKCDLRSRATELHIYVHEWPLSADESIAKATIFELQVPEAYSQWRDVTMFLLMDVLGFTHTHVKKARAKYTLSSQDGLSDFWASSSNQRINIVSEVKPLTGCHYRVKSSVAFLEKEDICVANALQYQYFDDLENTFATLLRSTEQVRKKCTYQLPARSLQLQTYLQVPTTSDDTTPNKVIASLSNCPSHFSLAEFKAFASLPIGYRIQYQNILVQLAMPAIDLAKIETHCLVLQTIHRAGPRSDSHIIERLAHEILAEEPFCQVLLGRIGVVLGRVSENWESWRAVANLVQLISRILSINTSKEVTEKCLELLEETRQITLKWLNKLKERLPNCVCDPEKKEISSRLTEIGLLCTSTFDADGVCLETILSSSLSVSVLIQTSIVVQENKGITSSEHEYLYRTMLQSWRLLLFRAFSVFSRNISSEAFQKGLSEAVLVSLAQFRPTGCWTVLKKPQHHWIYVKSNTMTVHFNLLTAELLVKGLPLSKLPQHYMEHHLYAALFEGSPIEIMPTDEPGMEFSSKDPFHPNWRYKLSFGMKDSDLLILAVRDGMKFDLVPSNVFKDRLPAMFVDDHFHWYDYNTGEVKFRPRENPWSPMSEQWRLRRCGASWRLVSEHKSLVDPLSSTGKTISRLLSPLEVPSDIHILFDSSSTVYIALPRRRLDFHFAPGEMNIYSRQYQGMVIDANQQIGTLFGLINKLVLKDEQSFDHRMVLIPKGNVDFSTKLMDHPCVSIDLHKAWTTHVYHVDDTLGRLVDDGSLQSKLFLCYLHALTSHCLPDSLTGCSGTEAALSILRSGAVASFDVLTASNIDILYRIARLTPKREFYPRHKQVMQQVQWDENLSFMSQHPGFYTTVDKLFRTSLQMAILQPIDVMVDVPKLDFVEHHLLQRDMIRTSIFRVDGFGAEHHTHEFDREYEARARLADTQRGSRCSNAAELIFRNQPTLHSPINARSLLNSLRTEHLRDAIVQGPNRELQPCMLRYDTSWLEKPSSFLPDIWCSLHSVLTTSPRQFNKFDLMTWASTAAFSEFGDTDVIQALAAFYNCYELATIDVPSVTSFNLAEGDSPTLEMIKELVQVYRDFRFSPEYNMPRQLGESHRQWEIRRRNDFEISKGKIADAFASALHAQWPCVVPTIPRIQSAETYLNTGIIMSKVFDKFKTWYDNRCFYQYLEKISNTLAQQSIACIEAKDIRVVSVEGRCGTTNASPFYSIDDIFSLEAPLRPSISLNPTGLCWPLSPQAPQIPIDQQFMDDGNRQAQVQLASLCRKLRVGAETSREKDYILDLRESCDLLALQGVQSQARADASNGTLAMLLETYLSSCRKYFDDMNSVLEKVVLSGNQIAAQTGQLPRISPTFWLRQLNRDRFDSLTQDWKERLIEYGLAITEIHRARRLVALSSLRHELIEEWRNRGHQNWAPIDFPETLLLEAESGFLVREVQEDIAKQMRCPPNDLNSVMQLNMGEGKSSVIIPMVAAFLAQGEVLVRVIVAKPQSRQMFQLLVSKLGGLLDRRIYHMPFSRALQLCTTQADTIGEIYQECMTNRGIMLVQPEHILSFKLMGIECLLNGQPEVGQSLLRTQDFFDNKSRDIVDESDENFNVKFELIYTMGSQRAVELSPERWSIIHSILELVTRYVPDVKNMFPSSIEFDDRWESRYPRTRILRYDAEEKLLQLISEHICNVGISGLLSLARQSPAMKQAVLRYIRKSDLTLGEIDEVENGSFWTETTKGPLLLLRGLIAGGVLSFALKLKRWRVDYGVDTIRTPKTHLAVPYRSKDSPSPRSEFSHPDVVITLTSLTYYYGGLGDQELFDTFAHLERSDQAAVEYQEWVRFAMDLPETFRHLTGVNIKDHYQCAKDIFPLLRYSKGAIDYFLSHIVFPKEMKEFPHKLSASGWDLGAIKSNPTTGFSGTNDLRQVLPLSVHYLDSEKQKHTNALVLAYLLQDEKAIERLPPQTDAEHLLAIVNAMKTPTRVILDAGAQILELNNLQVAQTWLNISNSNGEKAKAVIFFDENQELSVLDQNGCVELLQTSPFAKSLHECLVYLDQAHTRGTDLKMPRNYRAAVTLGANVTKDTLVQACMRMRKLGKGQSVVFCIPEEIQTKVMKCTSKLQNAEIEVSDILVWAITETWADMRRSIPLWASQGHRYERNKNLLNGAGLASKKSKKRRKQAKKFLETEAQSLEDRFRPRQHKDFTAVSNWNTKNKNIREILKRCREFEVASFNTATLQEEQERELSPEIEEEREVQRPAPVEAERHKLHPDLVRLVDTGILPARTEAFLPAFQALKSTSAAKRFDLMQFPNDVLVTADFMHTVKHPGVVTSDSLISDSYLRPVQWIISILSQDRPSAPRHLVILSPFEAEKLLPILQTSHIVTMHVYAARPTQGHEPLDKLDLYCVGAKFDASGSSISRGQIVQLNLFAGQLYFDSYAEYIELCKFLGLAWEAAKEGEEL